MNSIIELLDLEDADIYISDINNVGTRKYLTPETHPHIHFCPVCGFRMHSKGTKIRTFNHPVLQDSYSLLSFGSFYINQSKEKHRQLALISGKQTY